MSYQLNVDGIPVAVTSKNIKNLHLAVYPPHGDVRVSAPLWMDENRIKYFVLSKMAWIKKKRSFFLAQPREEAREFLNMETHYVWGKPRLLQIHPDSPKNEVNLDYDVLRIHVKGSPDRNRMHELLEAWYRRQVAGEAVKIMDYWRGIFGLPPVNLCVRHMKTRWGSCLPSRNKILLNTELGKKPRECLEYVAVHELAHFFVPNHGEKFKLFMNTHLPNWKSTRKLLNNLPLGM